jgi:hypothetical protein
MLHAIRVSIVVIVSSTAAFASNISGVVSGLQQDGITGVTVQALSQANNVLGRAVTDANGAYQLAFGDTKDAIVLAFRKAGRENVTLNGISGAIRDGKIDVIEPVEISKGEKSPCNCDCQHGFFRRRR